MNLDWQPFIHLPPPGPRTEVVLAQSQWLLKCLQRNAHCAYGASHGFEHIESVKAFQEQVPLSDEADLAPWIHRMAQGHGDELFCGRPIAFERTSGSTGPAKLVAYSAASMGDFSHVLRSWLGSVVRRYALSGPAYWSISAALGQPKSTPGGTPIGLPDAAFIGEDLMAAFASVSAVPPAVGAITDLNQWQNLTWRALLESPNLSLISIWSPTFFLSLLDALPQHAPHLEDYFRTLGQHDATARLQRYLATGDGGHLWPQLRLVSCWGDGASRSFLEQLRSRLPQAAFQPKGLMATEGVVTVPDADDRPVLAASSGFFEFIGDDGRVHLAQDLMVGNSYEVVMTTNGGLYRYRLGDRVRMNGWAQGWPVLEFIGRSKIVSDLVGEKLTESFVAECFAQVFEAQTGFHMLIAQTKPKAHYVLIADRALNPGADNALDRLIECQLERSLERNPHYRYARQLGQLGSLRIHRVPHPLQSFNNRMTEQRVLQGNIKAVALRPELDWLATFSQGQCP